MLPPPTHPTSPWPHRWAWLLACTTFPLVWCGGFVTATGSGMAFREWLTPDGHFMLTYPWLSSSGDKFIEHGHRLLGALVGFLTICLVVVVHRCESRTPVRRFSLLLLAAVIGQGGLGALRVVLDKRTLALLHGCTGPLFFALCGAMVVVTSAWWTDPARIRDRSSSALSQTASDQLKRLAGLCALLAYGQLVLGAFVRHGRFLTSDAAAMIFQTAVYFHVIVAVLVVAHLIYFAWRAFRARVDRPLALGLAGLVAVQFLLGLTTWLLLYGQPAWVAQWFGPWNYVNQEAGLPRAVVVTAHGAVGSLIFALSLAAWLRAGHRSGWRLAQRWSVRPAAWRGASV